MFRPFSYMHDIPCSNCGKIFSINRVNTYCGDCRSPLLVNYDLDAVRKKLDRDEISQRQRGMWRWHELLPVRDHKNIVSLGEGDSALLHLSNLGGILGLNNLFVKDESTNPSGSFKARGLSAAVSRARELGIWKLVIPTAGNAGGALAAYAARAGMEAHIFMPKDAPQANVMECKIAGASVVLVEGLISDAAAVAGEKARQEGWFDVSTFKEPYRVEGKKVMGYELAEALGWILPDVILYPTGGGTGLVGMWKAFLELERLGWLQEARRPRMVAVQAEGCAPIVKAFESGAVVCESWPNASTIAAGLRVPRSFADAIILRELRESQGTAIAVSDSDIVNAQRTLGKTEGIFAAPEGAATLVALEKLARQKWILPDDRVVLFNTGSGLKYLD